MSEPTKQLMRLVLSGELAHGGHPVLRWCMDNVVVRTDPAGNIKMDKARAVERIDGSVALVMALDRTMRCGGAGNTSVSEPDERLCRRTTERMDVSERHPGA